MSDIKNMADIDVLLSALGEQLAAADEHHELVVIGGSGLLAIGAIERATRDIDIVALHSAGHLSGAKPLPEGLRAARERVARDFSLPTEWLNPGPTDLLELGLPKGFVERLDRRGYGEGLVVYFASRYDQIHFKLYALVDQGPGKHENDLRALSPSEDELIAAADWTRSQDPSEGYAQSLRQALTFLGVEHGLTDD
jgi:hypothetical protein